MGDTWTDDATAATAAAKPADILFVEDDRDLLDLGVTVLREARYEVVSAVNADIGLILLEEGVPFRLLVADVVLPGRLDGFSLARRARELLPRLDIIYLTGFPVVADIRSRGAPWGPTLLKPIRNSDFVKTVGSVLPPPAAIVATEI